MEIERIIRESWDFEGPTLNTGARLTRLEKRVLLSLTVDWTATGERTIESLSVNSLFRHAGLDPASRRS